MSIHEYVFITISIIYGVAITRLLSNIFDLIRHREIVTLPWASLAWISSVLMMLLWFIWIGFSFRSFDGFTYPVFVHLTLTTICLYGAVEFSVPQRGRKKSINWDDYGNSIDGRMSFSFVVVYFVSLSLGNILIAQASIVETLVLTFPGIAVATLMLGRPNWFPALSILFLVITVVTNSPLQLILLTLLR